MDDYQCRSVITKLRRFAKKIGVQLRIFEHNKSLHKQGYLASYNVYTRVILVDKKAFSSNEKLIYTIAHELGHAVDLDKEPPECLKALSDGLIKYAEMSNAGVRVPKPVQEFVLDRERRAFLEGDSILEQIDVQLPADLKQEAVLENELNYWETFNLSANESN